MNTLAESTKKYYQKRVDLIYEKIKNKIKSNIKDYEAYINVPFTKSMIRFKFDFDLEIEDDNNVSLSGFSTVFSENDIIDVVVNESLETLISSSIEKMTPTQTKNIYLSENLIKETTNEIKSYLDDIINLNYKNQIEKQLNSIKYLYFGKKHLPFISETIKLNKIHGYCGEYKGIKFFYIDTLEDIYLSSSPFIDLNSIDVRYNEYIKEEFSNLFDVDVLYETVPDSMKKGVLTLNCLLGDVNIIKLKCYFSTELSPKSEIIKNSKKII